MATLFRPSEPNIRAAVLNSWKEVAAYMGRGVRTVQRWEATLGLPIHRAGSTERSPVLAFPRELDAWLAARPISSNSKSSQRQRGKRPAETIDFAPELGDVLTVHLHRMAKLLVSVEQLRATRLRRAATRYH